MSNIRTYILKHSANKSKQDAVMNVLAEYRKTCSDVARKQWRMLFDGSGFNKMADLSNVKSPISERYKRNCAYQVVSSLESYISNRQNEFARMVYRGGLNDDTRVNLLKINRRRLWFKKEHELFSASELFLARKIFKHILHKHRKPYFKKVNMLLNENVAKIIPFEKAKAKEFDYWIRFSTLQKNKPILIPIKNNDYFKSIDGKLTAATQFNFSDGEFTVSFMKDIPKKKIVFRTKEISLDFGLKSLFTCADGNMFGKGFYDVLVKYDKIISELAKNRQKQGLPIKCKHYNTVVSNLKEYIKNEVNRVLNKIISIYKPEYINLENLNFKDSHLSRYLNRIIRNCGRSVIERKLASLESIYGIKSRLIHAAYTSQECSHCHYVDKKNRQNQKSFRCKNCRHTIHADVNGARVNEYRSSVPELANIYTSRKTILRKIVTLFMEQNPRLNSKAKCLLENNPYFSDYHGKLKLIA